MDRIRVSGPSITQREIDYVTDAVATAWYGEANKYHDRFERAFAEYVGRRFAIALPSCTSALHLALLSLGIGPGDQVILPDVTWIASAAPITYVGATAVFADIDEKTWCLTPESVADCLTPATRAIIPVDLYGNMPDMDGMLALAGQNDLAVVEDAAEAIGSEFGGRRAGSFGDASAFSFHGSKTLTTGEGGMLVTDRADIHARALFLRDHGREPGDVMFVNSEVAYKYKMSSMQAALGLAQTERVEELVAKKRLIFSWYQERLGAVEGLRLNHEAEGTKNTYWMVTAVIDASYQLPKDVVMRRMSEYGIDCRPMFSPLSAIPAFSGQPEAERARERNKVSYRVSPYGVNLPSGMDMTEDAVERVCATLLEVLG